MRLILSGATAGIWVTTDAWDRMQRAHRAHMSDNWRIMRASSRARPATRSHKGITAALIGDAELLAADVHDLVDAIEVRQADRLLGLTVQAAETETKAQPRRQRFALPARRVRVALGASLAMSLALVEC